MMVSSLRDPITQLFLVLATSCAAISLLTHSTLLTLATIIVFGVPHGALDGEAAREALRYRYGRIWFFRFSLPYLGLMGTVLALWKYAPETALIIFLLMSIVHFGLETKYEERSPVTWLVLGAAPIMLPVLFHPNETTGVFNAMAGVTLWRRMPPILVISALIWSMIALFWLIRKQSDAYHLKGAIVLLAFVFLLMDPLTGFMLYFVFFHAPEHIRNCIASSRYTRVTSFRTALLRSLPLSMMTLLIGLTLWPLYHGGFDGRLYASSFQLLSALTLPHMLFEYWLSKQPQSCVNALKTA